MKRPNIKVTVHLWNNDLTDSPCECWDIGQVSVQRGENPEHPIKSGNAVLFNRPEEFHPAMLKCLDRAGVAVHASNRKRKVAA